jgi:PAS domain S-box-containing protein
MPLRLSHIAVLLTLATVYLLGGLVPIDRAIGDLRFELLRRPATGSLALVAIDARSLKELDVWPWPRTYHAAVLDRLVGAGARVVAFDIDFSSRRNADEDALFAAAIARSGGRAVLPTFRQRAHGPGPRDEEIVSTPIPALREAARLALVNVRAEADGRVRSYIGRDNLAGVEVPSLAAVLAEPARGPAAGLIDFAVDPSSLPRLSYVDVLRGAFDPAAVAGKAVIVGATAVELGDQLPVPVYGILPGSVLQGLAYESIVQDRSLVPTAVPVALLVGTVLAVVIARRSLAWSWQRGLAATGSLALAVAAAGVGVQAVLPILPDAAFPILAPLCCFAVSQLHVIDLQATSLRRERSLAVHRRAMVESVVEDSFHGIVIADAGGRIELFNSAAETILGVAAASAIGAPVERHLPRSPQLDELLGDRAPADGPGRTAAGPFEVDVVRRDGTTLPIELMVSRSLLRSTTGKRRRGPPTVEHRVVIYTFRDISERRRAEAAQRRAMEEAVAANRAKTEFLANMSHELRTPLNAIIGFSEMLKHELLGPLGHASYRAYSEDILNSAHHLLAVINDILDMSKIEAGEMRLNEELIDIARVAHACLRLIDERARKAKVSIAIECAEAIPPVRADERLIKQIFLNLLSNSVKFTPAGGAVTLRAAIDETGAMVLSVQDTGIGIAPEDIQRALAPFGQVDSRLARQYEGTGLGLPLVKAMAELHGATVTIDSAVGVGTTVSVRFPPERLAPPVWATAELQPA